MELKWGIEFNERGRCIPSPVWCFVSKREKKEKRGADAKVRDVGKEERELLCKQCENKVTRSSEAIAVAGGFEHSFLNPGGVIYRIGCFRMAGGCSFWGIPTSEWSWFEGFEWRVAICTRCSAHLGWYFSADDRGFFGLILDLLV